MTTTVTITEHKAQPGEDKLYTYEWEVDTGDVDYLPLRLSEAVNKAAARYAREHKLGRHTDRHNYPGGGGRTKFFFGDQAEITCEATV